MNRRRALVIANRLDADPGFVGERARELGFELHTVAREDLDALGAAVDGDGFDLVISLGSEWSVYWERVAQPVAAEQRILRRAHAAGTPVLGICFGAQILAAALGGAVERAPAGGEIGWYVIDTDDPALIEPGPWFQWHGDVFTPPPGAAVLATSPIGPQAFRLGPTLAVQFHPEVTLAMVTNWADGGKTDLDEHGIDRAALLAATRVETARTEAAAHRLLDRFLAWVDA